MEDDAIERDRHQDNRNPILQTEDQQITLGWRDLSHDTDVNHLEKTPELTREEREDIEVLFNDKYVPLTEILHTKTITDSNVQKDIDGSVDDNTIERFKREISKKSEPENPQEDARTVTSVFNDISDIEKHTDESVDDNSIERLKREISNKSALTKPEEHTRTVTSPFDDISEAHKHTEESIGGNSIERLIRKISNDFAPVENQEDARTVTSPFDDILDVQKHSEQSVDDNTIERLKRDISNEFALTKPEEHAKTVTSLFDDISEGINQDSVGRKPRDVTVPEQEFFSVRAATFVVNIEGLRIENSDKEPRIIEESIPSVLADSRVTLRLFGDGITSRTVIAFTHEIQQYGQPCKFLLKGEYMVKEGSLRPRTALFDVVAPAPITDSKLYICAKNLKLGVDDPFKDEEKYLHQGTEVYKMLASHNKLLPLWATMLLIMTCLTFSALFSGLNLGLMSLDRTELKIISNTGTVDVDAGLLSGVDPKGASQEVDGQVDSCAVWSLLASHKVLLPLWATMLLIMTCLTFSALFSGLNLGLMSLDRTELKIISNTGTEQERKYARAIMPVRDHGNYLLCSILLGNVAVNSTFTILLDELTSGLFAVIFSTLAIVLLGEITPQAICSRHGLMVGAKSIMVTKAVMALTAPLAFPISKLLDYFLGEEIGSVYNRERLKELVKVTTDVNDLDKDEVNIISGALELRKKTVSDVMTKLEDVFMLPISSVLDFETMSEIIKSGYSRIPVYEGGRGNIVTVLFIKDLAFVDPDDNTPLRTLCQYYQNPCNFVFEDVTLDVIFKQFKEGHKGHMAFVHRINNEGEGDPFYETMGLVTLEDVIEEMIQAEIVDETDVFLDNRSKRRRNRPTNKLQDFAAFAERHENQRIHISPQLTLATFQFLSTSVDAFRPDTVSETVLRRLLKQDVIHHIKLKGKTKKDPSTYVFQQGKPVDYFVLILEGRVEVTVGRENLVFEAGPFTYFGVQALTQNVGVAESPTPSAMGSLQNINMDSMLRHTFVPDYSVRAITELFYLTVKR
ncbi:hypothetical protein PYW07_013107 [Mythimna separata]|uniref:Uncharacterized protein n=1 Tax=Mythimna separata TaxID=271217 RepID=A0AAD7Y5X0_MYTSE|nr:hypothetical protein PYW07_013107 [Mythimna separata]